jgi:hypothetical protein
MTFDGELRQIIEAARAEQGRSDTQDNNLNGRWSGAPERWLSFKLDGAAQEVICSSCFDELKERFSLGEINESVIKGKVKCFVALALKP